MLDTLFFILVGAMIGWHFPQPTWAKFLTERILSLINKK
jgi:hypothetical protein